MKIKTILRKSAVMYYVKEMVFVSPCRKVLVKLSIYITFFVLAILFCAIPQLMLNRNLLLDNRPMRFASDLKYILFWKPQQHKTPYQPRWPQGQTIFIKQKCKNINCYITYDQHFLRKDHRNLDAVVFNIRDIVMYHNDINLTRSANQKYIFSSMDSSEKYPVCHSFYENFFNLTWTYKLNSDIPNPFINIFDANKTLIGPKINIDWIVNMTHNDRTLGKLKGKKKAVAWVLNKCKTKLKYQDFVREFTNELKSYNYTLDIFGSCGNKKCTESHPPNCYKIVEKNYFFQLILEDSYAEDYVTEKIVKAMQHIAVPIILGSSNFDRFLPPGSYINAQTYDMKKIGAIIDYLIRYPNTYSYFFDWKNYYYYTVRPRRQICGICDKLNNYENANVSKVYNNFRNWWNPEYRDICQHLKFRNIFTDN